MRRLDKGAPLRAAMKAAGLDIGRLAARTREIDPAGKGVSRSLVGFAVSVGSTGREECSDRTAELIATALGREVIDLFQPAIPLLRESTSTRGSRIEQRDPLPAQLMNQKELSEFLRMSSSWIDAQITEARAHGETWPGLIYVGHSRRFDPHAVLDGLRREHASA